MSEFGDLKVRMGRKPLTVVELDLDFCANRYGNAPCVAAVGVTGDVKCFNTFKTCQDRSHFDKRVKTYRLTTLYPDLPVGDQVYPCIKDVSIAPTKIEMKGISLRASVTITCMDFPDHDRGLDPYAKERPDAPGTFFGKLKRRNPYVVNRPIRVIPSYLGEDGKVYGEIHHYLIQSIDGPDSNGRVVIKAKDVLTLGDEEKAKAPIQSSGKLVSGITKDASLLALYPTGIVNKNTHTGFIRIGDEVIGYSGKNQNGLTGLQRGLFNSVAVDHAADDKVQACLSYADADIADLVSEWLMTYAGVDPLMIPLEDWREECRTWLGMTKLTGLITEPTGVNKLVEELQDSTGSVFWWDERRKQIRFKVLQIPMASSPPRQLTDKNDIIKGSLKIVEKEQDRRTRVSFFYHLTRQWDGVKDDNFSGVHVSINADAESEFAYDEEKELKVLSRWLSIEAVAGDISDRALRRKTRELHRLLLPRGLEYAGLLKVFASPLVLGSRVYQVRITK